MFTWIPLYQEIARHILPMENRQDELISILRRLRDRGLPVITLNDKASAGQAIELQEIDPFSFFASFNRGQTLDNRVRILEELRGEWGLSSNIPSEFDGIPIVDNRQSWFFLYAENRGSDDIAKLWRLARETVEQEPSGFDHQVLDDCLAVRMGSLPKLSMAMFWLNPYKYLAVDSRNREYLSRYNIKLNGRTARNYFQLLDEVRSHFNEDFPTISRNAYLATIDKHEGEGINTPSPIPAGRRYWWLNANPKIWNFESKAVGEKQTYTSHNERGNKRQKYRYFSEVKPGDILVGYVTSPQKEVIAVCEITRGLHQSDGVERIEFKKIEQLQNPVTYEELKAIPALAQSEPLVSNQGSLFALSEEEFEIIRAAMDEKNPPVPPAALKPYTKREALAELFLSEQELDDMVSRLRRKKNVILQGPPGVGKTFVARRLAFLMMGVKDASRVQMVQFHQSYAYEDFIQGYRPNDDGRFIIKPGIFYEFCRKAQRDPEHDYFFIIDEINRGNLSKIFGELMMLIEHDKRGPGFAIPLTYARSGDDLFYIPDNFYLIGMMNTADRSLSLVDYALRRRFAFVTLHPKLASEKFAETLAGAGASSALIHKIRERVGVLNKEIADDERNLGPGYQIGHSYFCPGPNNRPLDEAWYREVIESEIRPLLEEYWVDESGKVGDLVGRLLD